MSLNCYFSSKCVELCEKNLIETRGSQLTPVHLLKLIKIDKMDENQ